MNASVVSHIIHDHLIINEEHRFINKCSTSVEESATIIGIIFILVALQCCNNDVT